MDPNRPPTSLSPWRRSRLLAALCWVALGACGDQAWPLATTTQALTDGTAHDGHPAVGLLEVTDAQADQEIDYCTATLVGQRTVLTSAHCLADQRQHLLWLAEQPYSAQELIVHGAWDAANSDFPNDIGVLRLSEAPGITPIALSPAAAIVGLPVTLVGFGSTADGRLDHGVKRIATNVIDQVDDKRFTFSGSGGGLGSTCDGDSGGPVLAKLAGQEVIIGINSAGVPPCGTRAVTTRVDAYLPWLRRWANGDLVEATQLPADAACRQLGSCPADTAGGCSSAARPSASEAPGTGWLTILLLLGLLRPARSRPQLGGRAVALATLVMLGGMALPGCKDDTDALLLVVKPTDPIATIDLQVKDLRSGELVLTSTNRAVERSRQPPDADQELRIAIEFAAPGRFLVHLLGASSSGEGRQVGIRDFRVSGATRATLALIPLTSDDDGDGFPACGAFDDCTELNNAIGCEFLDCEDADPKVNRFGQESNCNGLDDDCSAGCEPAPTDGGDLCADGDGDTSPGRDDCDDSNPCRSPKLLEAKNTCGRSASDFALPQACLDWLERHGQQLNASLCGDGIDNDCDGADVACEVDADCDSLVAEQDCDDTNAQVNRLAAERCNGFDDDCDGVTDEGCDPCDVDNDGHASPGVTDPDCSLPKDDLDDYDAGVHPQTTLASAGQEGQTALNALREYCSGKASKNGQPQRDVDHDLDGKPAAEDGCPPLRCDRDGDGFASADCSPPTELLDCNDSDPQVFPGAPDKCGDGIQQDCLGSDASCATDKDGDGYGAGDCDDDPASPTATKRTPWAKEVCDGIDNDCDGLIDEGNPDSEGELIATREGEPSCSDRGVGRCAPCPANATECDSALRVTGVCACSPREPQRDSRYAPDPATRVACSGAPSGATPSQRCFGAEQPTPERCDTDDWDCDGSPTPSGDSFVDQGKSCGIDRGGCKAGTVVGCDLSQPNVLAQRILAAQGIVHNPHWVCSDDTRLPLPELCNGRDDDCDGAVAADEQDRDGDGFLGCSGCTSIEDSELRLPADLRGCGDCAPQQASTYPGADELCNGLDDNCSRGVEDDGQNDDCGEGRACCRSLVGGACRLIRDDPENCGDCGRSCRELGGDSCNGTECVCGDNGMTCPANLDCVDGKCTCVVGGRCPGCCDGDSCVTSFSPTVCGSGGAPCGGCDDDNPCTDDVCSAEGVCQGKPRPAGRKCDGGSCDALGRCCTECLIGDQCVATGTSDPRDLCRWCDPARSQSRFVTGPKGRPCEDDGRPCTDDVCDRYGSCQHPLQDGFCQISGECHEAATDNPNNSCEWCDPNRSTWYFVYKPRDAACTDDGLSCTDDVCGYSGNCTHRTKSDSCLISGRCYAEGDLNPSDDCQHCAPAQNQSYWSYRAERAPCTTAGGLQGRCLQRSCCAGCADSWYCYPGNHPSLCGSGGDACKRCKNGQSCEAGECI